MDRHEIIKVPDDSPKRCQQVHRTGQCNNQVVEGTEWCPIHISSHNRDYKNQQIRNYNLTTWRARVHQLADSPALTSLREDVGIMRLLVENLINTCKTPTELIIHQSAISDLQLKVQRLVKDCHSLEKSTGQLLDKSATLKIAGDIVDIISTHIQDKALLEVISNEIIEKVINALPSQEDGGEDS